MIIVKLFSIIIGLVVISKTIHDYKKGKESLVMCLFWLITWASIILLTLFPILIYKINSLISGNGPGINTFIGAAFVFMFFVVYRVYTKANRLERQIHDMVMKIGLKDLEELD